MGCLGHGWGKVLAEHQQWLEVDVSKFECLVIMTILSLTRVANSFLDIGVEEVMRQWPKKDA